MHKETYGIDGPAEIEKCLACQLPECINCMRFGGAEYKPKKDRKVNATVQARKTANMKRAKELYSSGLNAKEVGKIIGVGSPTVLRWLHDMGVEVVQHPNKKEVTHGN